MKKSKKNTLRIIKTIFSILLQAILNLGVVVVFATFFLAFVTHHQEYLITLPPILLIGIIIGFIALMVRVATINWASYLSNEKEVKN